MQNIPVTGSSNQSYCTYCMEDNINQFCQGISVFSFIKHTDIWFVKKDKNKINLSIYFYQKDYIIHIKQKN